MPENYAAFNEYAFMKHVLLLKALKQNAHWQTQTKKDGNGQATFSP